jgi:hypothetical protein
MMATVQAACLARLARSWRVDAVQREHRDQAAVVALLLAGRQHHPSR